MTSDWKFAGTMKPGGFDSKMVRRPLACTRVLENRIE
jgi:hypothetical protein